MDRIEHESSGKVHRDRTFARRTYCTVTMRGLLADERLTMPHCRLTDDPLRRQNVENLTVNEASFDVRLCQLCEGFAVAFAEAAFH